jgi:hypothetical protein
VKISKSQIFTIISIVLLLFTYTGGKFFEYHDPVTGEVEFDEENMSFQPLSMLIPEGTEKIDTPPELVKYLGKTQYEYFPEKTIMGYVTGYWTLPVWRVSLEAPQYPKASYPEGIPVFFTLTDFRGKVVEMNVINHYIGMDPMDVGAYELRKLVPFVVLIFLVMLVGFLFYSGPGWWILGLGPALFPFYYVGIYSYWLYWFGHNLHSYGAFEVKPFMPTVLGDGKVAQFGTHSYPAVGFYMLFAMFILMLLAILSKRKALSEKN